MGTTISNLVQYRQNRKYKRKQFRNRTSIQIDRITTISKFEIIIHRVSIVFTAPKVVASGFFLKNYLLLKSVLACRVSQLESVEHVEIVLPCVLVDNHFACGQFAWLRSLGGVETKYILYFTFFGSESITELGSTVANFNRWCWTNFSNDIVIFFFCRHINICINILNRIIKNISSCFAFKNRKYSWKQNSLKLISDITNGLCFSECT